MILEDGGAFSRDDDTKPRSFRSRFSPLAGILLAFCPASSLNLCVILNPCSNHTLTLRAGMASAATNITFTCPNCAKVLRSTARPPAGTKVKCPACGEVFLPELDEDHTATAIQSRDEKDEDVKPSSKTKRADDDEDYGPAARNVTSRKTVMPARSSATPLFGGLAFKA
jgi:hypothetical protein